MPTHRLTREIPVDDSYDILVAGGGPAGTAAAVCAARLGAKVLLAEATGCLGGMGTSGLVSTFGPVSDGKRMLVGGFMKELVESLYQRGDLGPHVVPEYLYSQLNRWVPFKPEALKRTMCVSNTSPSASSVMSRSAAVPPKFASRANTCVPPLPVGRAARVMTAWLGCGEPSRSHSIGTG